MGDNYPTGATNKRKGPGNMQRKLSNGATVLMARAMGKATTGQVVLAQYNGQLVTWVMDNAGHCFWGHYFGADEQAAALTDYQTR